MPALAHSFHSRVLLISHNFQHCYYAKWSGRLITLLFFTLVTLPSLATPKHKNDFLSQQEAAYVQKLIERHGSEIALLPLQDYPFSQQALYLGSWLIINDEKALGRSFLLQGIKHQDAYSSKELGDIYYLLAESIKDSQIKQAIDWYANAIAKGNIDACVNLGVLYEQQKQYQQAANTYQTCAQPVNDVEVTEQQTMSLLYLNLGTLYYNGLLSSGATRTAKLKGGEHWQSAYQLNPFDLDLNYNLGIYQLSIGNNYPRARYHFSLCAWQLMECASALAKPKLIGLSAEKQHLATLLNSQGIAREFLLEDRAKYLLKEPAYLNEQMAAGELQWISQPNHQQLSISFTEHNAAAAIATVNRLVFVDMFSNINALSYLWATSPLSEKSTQHLGQTISLKPINQQWQYSITIKEKW